MTEAMIRAATAADAEAIYELLLAARDEIPLPKIATDPKEDWLVSAHGARTTTPLSPDWTGKSSAS